MDKKDLSYTHELQQTGKSVVAVQAMFTGKVSQCMTAITQGFYLFTDDSKAAVNIVMKYADIRQAVLTQLGCNTDMVKLHHNLKQVIEGVEVYTDEVELVAVPPLEEVPTPNTNELLEAQMLELGNMLHTTVRDSLADIGQLQAQSLQHVTDMNDAILKLHRLSSELRTGDAPMINNGDDCSEREQLLLDVLVYLVGKTLPNTLIKSIKDSTVTNPTRGKVLTYAAVKAGGSRLEIVEQTYGSSVYKVSLSNLRPD